MDDNVIYQMAMYPEDKEDKYTELKCYECGKYCGLYFRNKPMFFFELFFCSLKCREDHVDHSLVEREKSLIKK